MRDRDTSEIVAIILALGVSLSIIILIFGVMWNAVKNGNSGATITENETQVLLACFSGIFGILGAFVGYRIGAANGNGKDYEISPDEKVTAPHPVIPPTHGYPTRED